MIWGPSACHWLWAPLSLTRQPAASRAFFQSLRLTKFFAFAVTSTCISPLLLSSGCSVTFFRPQVACSERWTWFSPRKASFAHISLPDHSLCLFQWTSQNVQLFFLFTYLICVLVVFAYFCSVSRGTSSGSIPTPPPPTHLMRSSRGICWKTDKSPGGRQGK